MKPIKIPNQLLELSFPWNITGSSLRLDEKDKLSKNQENIYNTLDTLRISLQVLSLLPEPSDTSIDRELFDYWNLTSEEIADEAPTFDRLDYSALQKVVDFHKLVQFSPRMLEEMAEVWVWTTTLNIARHSLIWLKQNLEAGTDDKDIISLLELALEYWFKIPEDLCSSLIGVSLIDVKDQSFRDKSINFLEEIEHNSPIDDLLKMARDYKKLILSRDKN
jgi:hypothetical protein